jgi:uncharacterized protein YhbP (UPF0306 family)
MGIRRSGRRIATARLRTLASALLDASTLCAIATVGPRGRAHVNTAYFAWADDFTLVWLSEANAAHSRNLRSNPSTAVAVYDSAQTWGRPDRGIQLFGSTRDGGRGAEQIYIARFPDYRDHRFAAYRFYRFRPRRLKLFDEPVLGRGVFVTARVRSGELEWECTEVYDSAA